MKALIRRSHQAQIEDALIQCAVATERERCALIAQREAEYYESERVKWAQQMSERADDDIQAIEDGARIHASRNVAGNIAALIRK